MPSETLRFARFLTLAGALAEDSGVAGVLAMIQCSVCYAVVGLPGMDFKPHMIVHGEHEIILGKPIPTAGTVETRSRVEGVYERASGRWISPRASPLVALDSSTFQWESATWIARRGSSRRIRRHRNVVTPNTSWKERSRRP